MPHDQQPPQLPTYEIFLFPRPVFLPGESPAAFEDLVRQIRSAVEQKDIVDRAWIHDFACSLWEGLRWRRMKSALLQEAAADALFELLVGKTDGDLESLLAAWRLRDPIALAEVERLLAQVGLTEFDVYAKAAALRLSDLEHFEALIARADARRDAVWRALDRRQAERARYARELAKGMIEDANLLPPLRSAAE